VSMLADALASLVSEAAGTAAGLGFTPPRRSRPRKLGRYALFAAGSAGLILVAGGLLSPGALARGCAWVGYGLLAAALGLGLLWVVAPHVRVREGRRSADAGDQRSGGA
jgi:hypothetical protein